MLFYAQRLGRGRATIANALRLLNLPDPVKSLVAEGRLSPGHAKVLLGLEIPREIELLAARCVAEQMSVRTLERVVQRLTRPARKPRAERDDIPEAHLRDLSDKLHQHFGTGVRITPSRTLANGKKVKGCITIDFYNNDDLDRVLVILGVAGSL
jgi:ParB family chromosome partitioning protein